MDLLQTRIKDDMKTSMREKNKVRLGVIRLILAAIKQREVDERVVLDDEQVVIVLDKMLKQRRESIKQYTAANRQDLADVEVVEIGIIQEYLPQSLSDEEIISLIEEAVSETGAASIKDMGKVMGLLKPKMLGRADMSGVSVKIKEILTA